ncbi:adenosylcobinamide-phosphate synthase CbiB [Sphingomonas profundi]|uniref:adenosylcobinamide-phosphate synthase CbiB n=1 Tax=Alterirhizorhabdus profundi TaxID=2681549 RepID=UPI0012E82723|nr:adenosylcobinamide-phosphate synthase CbiB [Sphingomonas profundi]
MAEPVASVALVLDAALGWPAWLYARIGHPVGAFARIIGMCERRWNRPERTEGGRRFLGVVTICILVTVAGGGAWLIQSAIHAFIGPEGWPLVALLACPALAQRSLHDHVRPVASALTAGDLASARRRLAMIVGRDTGDLDEAGVARAAIESLAESFCDGVAAPLFWLVVLGLPGVWAYKAVNTADSLIGHREERWRAFGWAAARTDDLLNLIPARLAGPAICLAGGGGWRVMVRDAGRHASPNAGWTEAAMAGALRLRLAGPVAYDGLLRDRAWIGDEGGADDAAAIKHALAIYVRACLLLWIVAGGIAWVR